MNLINFKKTMQINIKSFLPKRVDSIVLQSLFILISIGYVIARTVLFIEESKLNKSYNDALIDYAILANIIIVSLILFFVLLANFSFKKYVDKHKINLKPKAMIDIQSYSFLSIIYLFIISVVGIFSHTAEYYALSMQKIFFLNSISLIISLYLVLFLQLALSIMLYFKFKWTQFFMYFYFICTVLNILIGYRDSYDFNWGKLTIVAASFVINIIFYFEQKQIKN